MNPLLKPPVAHAWERERSRRLFEHSDPGTSARRRAQQLARTARRKGRAGSGVDGAGAGDDITPPLWRRRSRDEHVGAASHALFYAGVGLGLALAGGAVAAGTGIYSVLERWVAPRTGRLWAWPWAVLGALLIVGGALIGWLPGPGLLPGALAGGTWLGGWLLWQLAMTPLVVAWKIHAWGWAGVPRNAVPTPERHRDGSFRATPDSEKVRLDPLAGSCDADAADDDEPEPAAVQPAKVQLAPPVDEDFDDSALFGEPVQWPDDEIAGGDGIPGDAGADNTEEEEESNEQ